MRQSRRSSVQDAAAKVWTSLIAPAFSLLIQRVFEAGAEKDCVGCKFGSREGLPPTSDLPGNADDRVRGMGILPSRIVVVGQSLGDAPAAFVTSHRRCAGTVLISGFTSVPEAISDRFSWLPVKYLPWPVNRFDVWGYLRQSKAPVIIVASAGDELVPIANSRRLNSRLGPRATFLEVNDAPHNGLLLRVAGGERLLIAMNALFHPSVPHS